MIKVEGVTKRFSGITAVDNISFDVDVGEIIGFLGPNAAGKTTTMRMITTYLPPSTGKITIEGNDTVMDSLNVRRMLGYLPENVPLYNDLRVNEYLDFRARLKGVPGKERTKRLDEIINRCGLKDVQRKIIGYLSKGYRQRVGLAEAIVHNPKILILDEPTIGLDPNQIRQIRELIKELGRDRTVILSTHILPEVEIICNRVIIINHGKIVAQDTMEHMVKGSGEIIIKLEVKALGIDVQKALEEIPQVIAVSGTSGADNISTFTVIAKEDIRELVSRKISEHNWALRELHKEKATLEDIFVKVTAEETA
ncbi:MAG: ATP-binding cassette domain-containing protein [Planctomycetes bacterium]|nr:ATP-binding cassette domain-containing protein [Planctomycetota bacterium]